MFSVRLFWWLLLPAVLWATVIDWRTCQSSYRTQDEAQISQAWVNMSSASRLSVTFHLMTVICGVIAALWLAERGWTSWNLHHTAGALRLTNTRSLSKTRWGWFNSWQQHHLSGRCSVNIYATPSFLRTNSNVYNQTFTPVSVHSARATTTRLLMPLESGAKIWRVWKLLKRLNLHLWSSKEQPSLVALFLSVARLVRHKRTSQQ